MKLFSRHCIFIFFLFFVFGGLGQIQQVKFYTVLGTNGITLGKINGMTKDKYGFMWFSDQSNRCIIRFDGSHMTRYQNDPKNPNSLGGYYPECLFADAEGNIWIGFYGMGLDKFDPVTNTFTHFRHQKNDTESLSNDFVTAVLVDHLGNIWVGDYGGLDLLNEKTGKFKHYSNKANDPSSLSCNKVRSLYEDKAGVLWIGTGFAFDDVDEGGLNRFDRNTAKFTRYLNDPKDPHTLIANKVRAIFEDSYGNFWIGTTGDGLHIMDRKTGLFTRLTYHPDNPDQLSRPPLNGIWDHITFITEDADHKIWIGTLLNGLTRYDPLSKQITRFGNKYDKTRNDKEGIFKDSTTWWANASPDGIIWLSTQNANLYKIDIYNTIIPHNDVKENDVVFSFIEQNDSMICYGTANGVVQKNLKNGSIRRFVKEAGNQNSLSNNEIYVLLKDKQGDLWLGTRYGFNHFDLKTGNCKRYYHNPGNITDVTNGVSTLYEDSDSNIWVGTFGGGLAMLNRKSGKLTNYKNEPSDINTISNDVITSIIQDENGDLLVGTDNNGGLNKLNRHTGKFTHYLPGLVINCIYTDASGIIWIGTRSGLFYYDKKSDNFNSSAGENSGNNIVEIASITGDKEDNLWIGSRMGIYMLNKKRDQVIRFGKESGVSEADNFFFNGSSFTRHDGEVYFGYEGGYMSFYPNKLRISPGKTQLYFTRFWLDNKEIIPGKTSLLKESLFNSRQILLNHDQNVFSFNATFIDFRNPGDKKIYYKLENFDKDWRTAAPEERIQYFKIPSGNYTFRIKTANTSNGEWTEKSIELIISPPWWSTWWAYIIYGLLFVGAAFSIHRYQKERLIKAERERARGKELAQAREIEKAYHELKITQSQLIQSEKMASLGELTAGVAHEIQNPLNFVNNFSEVNSELIADMKDEIDKGNYSEVKAIASNIDENEQKIMFHGRRADAIVKGMLQHSRSSNGIKESTDINALVDEYTRLAYHGLRAKEKTFNATIKTDFDTSIGNINIIPQDIGRVILNLINNAFYAVNEKKSSFGQFNFTDGGYEPTVSIGTKKNNGIVEITIKDNGNGIPQKVMDKIFQPFFTTKPTGQGTGLGLSLSYDIIKAHGGEIIVQTKEGEGSQFKIQLPTA